MASSKSKKKTPGPKPARKPKRFTASKQRERKARSTEAKAILIALRDAGLNDIAIAYHAKISWRAVYRWRTGRERGAIPHPSSLDALRALARRKIGWGTTPAGPKTKTGSGAPAKTKGAKLSKRSAKASRKPPAAQQLAV